MFGWRLCWSWCCVCVWTVSSSCFSSVVCVGVWLLFVLFE